MGYVGAGRSMAMSALLEYRLCDRAPGGFSTVGDSVLGSVLFCVAIRFDLLFMLDRLGKPKSSPSSSS